MVEKDGKVCRVPKRVMSEHESSIHVELFEFFMRKKTTSDFYIRRLENIWQNLINTPKLLHNEFEIEASFLGHQVSKNNCKTLEQHQAT